MWQAAPLLDALGDSPPGSSSSQRRPDPWLVAPTPSVPQQCGIPCPPLSLSSPLLRTPWSHWAHLDRLPVSRSAYQQPDPSPCSMTRSRVPGLRTGPHLGRWSFILPTTQSHRPRFTRTPSNSRQSPTHLSPGVATKVQVSCPEAAWVSCFFGRPGSGAAVTEEARQRPRAQRPAGRAGLGLHIC